MTSDIWLSHLCKHKISLSEENLKEGNKKKTTVFINPLMSHSIITKEGVVVTLILILSRLQFGKYIMFSWFIDKKIIYMFNLFSCYKA